MNAELSDAELERYARHIVLPQVGGFGQRRLKERASPSSARAASAARSSRRLPAPASARSPSSIPTWSSSAISIGSRSFASATPAIRRPNSRCSSCTGSTVRGRKPVQERIDRDNAPHLLAGHDLVIDGSDNFATRLAVSDACVALGIPLLSAAAVQFQGQVGLFRSQPCYRCFVGDAFDCGRLRQLRGARGARRADRRPSAASPRCSRSTRIVGIGEDQAGKLHLFDGEKLSGGRSASRRPTAAPALPPSGSA